MLQQCFKFLAKWFVNVIFLHFERFDSGKYNLVCNMVCGCIINYTTPCGMCTLVLVTKSFISLSLSELKCI